MVINKTVGTGVLHLAKQTPVIKALFGPYRLDVANPRDGEAYICADSERRPTWNDVEDGLQALAMSLGLVPKGGSEVRLKELVAVLAVHYGQDAGGVQHLLDPVVEQRVELSELFRLADVLDDGHGLKAIEMENASYCSSPELWGFGGAGFYLGRQVVLHSSSATALVIGKRLDEALERGDVDAAAGMLQAQMKRMVAGVLDQAMQRELERRLGLPG